MRSLEKLLRFPTARERFQAVCVGTDTVDCRRFDHWSWSLKSLRWEAIFDFSHHLLRIRPYLVQYWHKEKYMLGDHAKNKRITPEKDRAAPENIDSEYGMPSCEHLDNIIRSSSFWQAVGIVENISYESEYVGRWAESCPCCGGDSEWVQRKRAAIQGLLPEGRRRRRKRNGPEKKDVCCFKGCRSSELASGEWRSRLRDLMILNRPAITHQIIKTDPERQSAYLHDWVAARSKLWSLLNLKLAYWEQLPWRLCSSSFIVCSLQLL